MTTLANTLSIKLSNTGTDDEACAYLYTAVLTQPVDHDWSQVYLYVTNKVYKRWNKSEIPEDIRVEVITEYQMTELERLKIWLYKKRTEGREESDRAERRQQKAEESAKALREQPELFKF